MYEPSLGCADQSLGIYNPPLWLGEAAGLPPQVASWPFALSFPSPFQYLPSDLFKATKKSNATECHQQTEQSAADLE
jgi:hypothetical protein